MNGLITVLIVLNTILTGSLIVLLAYFKRSIPDIQEVLDDVGSSIGEQLTGIFEKPIVKASMSQLGKKSGDVRASSALKNKVADKALGQNVLLKKALKYFDISPLEGLELMNDPTVGPFIQRFIGGLAKGGQGFGMGNSPGGSSHLSNRSNVPNMS